MKLRFVSLIVALNLAVPSISLFAAETPSEPQNRTMLVKSVCSDLRPIFADLRHEIDESGRLASDSADNAKGLGFWSGGKHFRVVEDNYIKINKMLEPALDRVTDIPIAVDAIPNSDGAKAVAVELASAYEKALRRNKEYSQAALVAERASNAKKIAQAENMFGGYATARNQSDKTMSQDQARTILDANSSEVKDASRSLKLPEFHWRQACDGGVVSAP